MKASGFSGKESGDRARPADGAALPAPLRGTGTATPELATPAESARPPAGADRSSQTLSFFFSFSFSPPPPCLRQGQGTWCARGATPELATAGQRRRGSDRPLVGAGRARPTPSSFISSPITHTNTHTHTLSLSLSLRALRFGFVSLGSASPLRGFAHLSVPCTGAGKRACHVALFFEIRTRRFRLLPRLGIIYAKGRGRPGNPLRGSRY